MVIFKTTFDKGATGATGETGVSFEVPTGAIIAYNGTGIPEGYEETNAPAGMGATLCGQDFTTEALYQSVSFYNSGSGAFDLISELPSADGIDTSSLTSQDLNMYFATPIGAGCTLEMSFGNISAGETNRAVQFFSSYDSEVPIVYYNIDASGNFIRNSQNLGNISSLANKNLKLKCTYLTQYSGAITLQYKLYFGSTLIDTFEGSIEGVAYIVNGIGLKVGASNINTKIYNAYVKGENQ